MNEELVKKNILQYNIGGIGFNILIAILLGIIAVGIYAYSLQFRLGEIVTGMKDIGTSGGAAWGIYIAMVVYFIGVSFAGITVSAIVHIVKNEKLKPISRMAELLTIISIVLGAMAILADLGQPLRGIVNLFLYARPMSPFFGTFSLVISGYLFSSLVFFYLAGRKDAAAMAAKTNNWFYKAWAAGYKDTPEVKERHEKTLWWLAIAIIPLLITAHSTLGFIFGIQSGRPGWFSALQAPGFVILAGASGIGLLILIAAILRQKLNLKNKISDDAIIWLGNFQWALLITYLYFTIVEVLTSRYTSYQREVLISNALLFGEFSRLFWLAIGLFVVSFIILFVQFLRKNYSIPMIVLAAIFVNIGAIIKRYLIVVPSQTIGTLLPYPPGSYTPTWVEYAVVLGLFAIGTLVYVLFVKIFPIVPLSEAEGGSQ